MSERTRQITEATVAAVMLITVILGTLTLAGHHWPQAPLHYQSKSTGISWNFARHATP